MFGPVQKRLWAQEVLRHLVCCWVGLCPHPVCCLTEASQHRSLQAVGCGQVLVSKYQPQQMNAPYYICHQHLCPQGRPQLHHLPPQETLQDQQLGLFRLLSNYYFCPWSRLHDILCAPFNSEVYFPQSCGASSIQSCWLSKPNALGASLPGAEPLGWQA